MHIFLILQLNLLICVANGQTNAKLTIAMQPLRLNRTCHEAPLRRKEAMKHLLLDSRWTRGKRKGPPLWKALDSYEIFGGQYKFRTCDPCSVNAVLYP